MTNNIAYLRIKHGLTQREFGKRIGMATHAVGYAEHHRCSVKIAKATAAILGENPFKVLGSDVLKMLPQTEEDKAILIEIINSL